jgi:hypothetical protein
MLEIRQFAVEMALGGRGGGIWNRILISALRACKAAQNAAFHIPSDGCCFVKLDEMQKTSQNRWLLQILVQNRKK